MPQPQRIVVLDEETDAILNDQPRTFNFSKFVRDALKELDSLATHGWNLVARAYESRRLFSWEAHVQDAEEIPIE